MLYFVFIRWIKILYKQIKYDTLLLLLFILKNELKHNYMQFSSYLSRRSVVLIKSLNTPSVDEYGKIVLTVYQFITWLSRELHSAGSFQMPVH